MNSWEPDVLVLLRERGITVARNDPLIKKIRSAVEESYIRGEIGFEVLDDAVIVRTFKSDGSIRIVRISMAEPTEAKRAWKAAFAGLLGTVLLVQLLKPASLTSGLLKAFAAFLPGDERAEWVEEQKGYLADLPKRRQKLSWIISQIIGMPRYAYTVRTGREKESA